MKGPFTAYLLALMIGGSLIGLELAIKYRHTQQFALRHKTALSYCILHAFLSLIIFHIISAIPALALAGKLFSDDPHGKALAAGLQWRALLTLSVFTVRTPEPAGKDVPMGLQLFWGEIASLFEGKIDEKEEIGLLEFVKPYKGAYPDVQTARSHAEIYLGTLASLDKLDKTKQAAMRKRFKNATTSEEVMLILFVFAA